MSVQIPFPLPAAGFALNSKVRVNLDFIVGKFNEFNTGTATWDAVYVGTGGAINGALTLYNSTNGFYTTIQSGVATGNQTYTLPVAVPPAATSVLMCTTGGVQSWSASPTLTGLSVGTGGTITGGIFNIFTSTRYLNGNGWATAFIPNAASAADITYTLPAAQGAVDTVLSNNGSGVMSWVAASSTAASKALDNLASVAINISLVSDTDNTDDLGTSLKEWGTVYARKLQLGKDAAAGELKLYSTSTLKGYLKFVAADNTANNSFTTITNAAAADSRTYTIPDAGANADFVMTESAQTINGIKSFTSALKSTLTTDQLILGTTTLVTINAAAPAASRTYTIPDPGAGANFLLSQGDLSIGGHITLAANKNIVLTDDTTNTVTLALPAAVTSYTLTLPVNNGDALDVLTTDGSGVCSWTSLTGAGGANNTLSNLSDTVAINKNLNNFTAGTITAALTGHASADLPLAAGAGSPVTGDLYLTGGSKLIMRAAFLGYLSIAHADTAISWTLTLPANHGTTGQVLSDSDGAGTLGWATVANTTLSNLTSPTAVNQILNMGSNGISGTDVDLALGTGDITTTGLVNLTGAMTHVATPVSGADAVTLLYLQNSVGVQLNYYLKTAGVMSSGYTALASFLTNVTTVDAETELTSIVFRSTVADTATPFTIKNGTEFLSHFNAKVSAGHAGITYKRVVLRTKAYYADSDGTTGLTQIGAASTDSAVLTESSIIQEVSGIITTETTVPAGKRLVLKVFAVCSGTAPKVNYPTVNVEVGDVHDHFTIGVTGILGNFLPLAGGTLTGALTMTENYLVTKTNPRCKLTDSANSWSVLEVGNGTTNAWFAQEGSSAGTSATGSTAYAGILTSNGAYPLQLGTNSTVRMTISSTGDIYTVGYTDYSSTSTTSGWAATPTKKIHYKKLGGLVYVWFQIDGTSNGTNATFTLPYAILGNAEMWITCRAYDNGSDQAAPGLAQIDASSSTVNCFKTWASGAWTASGRKIVTGHFAYHTSS